MDEVWCITIGIAAFFVAAFGWYDANSIKFERRYDRYKRTMELSTVAFLIGIAMVATAILRAGG